ncbi:hypothetical protein C0995_013448 [Termitomyces sp. Mi166|nr:hypothetical protein C0995_013448 [Termitomyces sp. Mi166\
MHPQSLLLGFALLFPRIVVGIPTNTSSKLSAIDASLNPSVTIEGKLVWKLVFDYDNSANTGSIVHFYEFSRSGSYSSQTFNEAVSTEAKKLAQSGSIQIESGVSYGPVSANVKSGFETSKEVSSMLERTTREQKEATESYTRKETRNYTIGAHSRLVLYQRVFQGPGITVQMETLKTTPTPLPNDQLAEKIPIELVLEPKKFVKSLKVVYSDTPLDAPADRVRDWFEGSDDINDTFGGLQNNIVSEALTKFDLVITSKRDPRYDDLSKGAGGGNRYLIPVKQSDKNLFISELTLARFKSDKFSSLNELIWSDLQKDYTRDINKGRGGDYLYLVWQLQRAYTV